MIMAFLPVVPAGLPRRGLSILSAVPRFGRRTPLTWSYVTALTVIGVLLSSLSSHWQMVIVANASTNLDNLGHWDLSTLATSAFIINEGPVWFTCIGVGCTLAVAELAWGTPRMLSMFALGHLGATSAVAVGLWIGISNDWLPVSWERASDVGVSYGVVAVLSGLTFSLPRGWRLPWATVWVALAAQSILGERSFTSVGHGVAVLLGLGGAWLALRHRGGEPSTQLRSPVALMLLVGAALFGLCIVGWGVPGWWTTPVVALIAVLAAKVSPVQRGLGVAQLRSTSSGCVASSASGIGWRRSTLAHRSTRPAITTSLGSDGITIQSDRPSSASSWPPDHPA